MPEFELASIPHRFVPYDGSLPPEAAALAGRPGREVLLAAALCDGADAVALSSLARRMIEVAVTGRASLADLVGKHGRPSRWTPALTPFLRAHVAAHFARPEDGWVHGRVEAVLARAVAVATYVTAGWHPSRFGEPVTAPQPPRAWHALRRELLIDKEWLAVAPERDTPAAPVNAGSTRFWQRVTRPFEVVPTRDDDARRRKVSARYILEGPDDKPVLLLVHGHGSRLEEYDAIVPELARDFCVVVPDLPSMGGYTAYEGATKGLPRVSDWSGLEFLLDFLVCFLDAVGLSQRKVFFGGGSLGGNLALLATTAPRFAHITGVAAWSPGSVWPQSSDDVDGVTASGFNLANLLLGLDTVKKRVEHGTETRAEFFTHLQEAILCYAAQPQHWYWSGWAPAPRQPNDLAPGETVRARYLLDAVAARGDVFCETMRSGHWQIAGEQLRLSHWSHVASDTPRYASYVQKKPVLLMWGEQDNLGPEHLGPCTAALAERMKHVAHAAKVPFRPVAFANTGHSIHNERPVALAREIKTFFGGLR